MFRTRSQFDLTNCNASGCKRIECDGSCRSKMPALMATTSEFHYGLSNQAPFLFRSGQQYSAPRIRWHVCLGCQSRKAILLLDPCRQGSQCFQGNLPRFVSRVSLDKESYPSRRASYRIARAFHGECIRILGEQSYRFAEVNQRRLALTLECQSAHQSRRCECLACDRVQWHCGRCRRLQEPVCSKLSDYLSLETANTYYDAVEHRPDFKKDHTVVREMLGTIFRLTASSAISRAVNCEIGRSASWSGFSQAIATIAACCSVVNFEVRPFRGWSANSVSISFFKLERGSLHSTKMIRDQSSRHRFRQTLACWGLSPTCSPISSLLCFAKARRTILARCTNRTGAVRLATISWRISNCRSVT